MPVWGDVLVEQDPSKGFVEVLAKASHYLVQDIHGSAALFTTRSFMSDIVVQEFFDWMWMGNGNKLLAFGHILPVVDEHGL